MKTEKAPARTSAASTMIPVDPRSYARELGAAYVSQVQFYRTHMNLSHEEADAAIVSARETMTERVETAPSEHISWHDLASVAETNPQLVQRTLDRIQADADDELWSGNRAARAVENGGGPWKRHQFLALIKSLSDEWRPQNGIERMLIETLAQAQTEYLIWVERLHGMTIYEAERVKKRISTEGDWIPPTITDADAFNQAMDMVDRFNRLIMRTVRTLKDLRRTSSAIVVQQASQINVARQQINVAHSPSSDKSEMELCTKRQPGDTD